MPLYQKRFEFLKAFSNLNFTFFISNLIDGTLNIMYTEHWSFPFFDKSIPLMSHLRYMLFLFLLSPYYSLSSEYL